MSDAIINALSNLPASVLVGTVALLVILVLFIPVALRVAGLTGQQIVDVLTLSLRFFIDLVHEFRAQNQNGGQK